MAKMSDFAAGVMRARYAHQTPSGLETWPQIADRVATHVLGAVNAPKAIVRETARLIRERKLMPGGRYLANAGRPLHQVQNCLLLRPEDSREGWATHLHQSTMALMTGAGIGGEYSDLRPKGAILRRTGGEASGPLPLIHATNEVGRAAIAGGSRRAAIWAGLLWSHPDCRAFVTAKDWAPEIVAMKARDYNSPAPLDHTNISVGLDDYFFAAYHHPSHPQHSLAHEIYWAVVRHMVETGEPGFSVNLGLNARESLRNACTEITSEDDSDICNLASINLARIESLSEMRLAVDLGARFLLAGTVYSDVPYAKVADVRARNRRLGLGLMGIHEWLLRRGLPYGPALELEPWLEEYAKSGIYTNEAADRLGLSRPVKTRGIAPNGTIGIVAETTTGLENLFSGAYLRRVYNRGIWEESVVIDPTARRLVAQGVDPDEIDAQSAQTMAADPGRRMAMQAFLQGYVDHGISSTINLPAWGSPLNNPDTVRAFGDTLIKFLPRLRGITAYPDGARSGQPLTPVPLREALRAEQAEAGVMDVCDLRGGSCGA